jgi:membrane-associated phospholipid phosphatase
MVHYFHYLNSRMSWEDVCTQAMQLAGELPLILTLSIVIGFFLAPRMYPGGCVRYLIGVIVVLLVVLSLKQLSCAVFPNHTWPYRPKLPQFVWSPGFPSSHAATMMFFTVTIALMPCGFSHPRRILFAVLLGMLTLLVCAQRYYTSAHSATQLLFGGLLGAGMGFSYAMLTPPRVCDTCDDDRCCP